MGYKTKYIVNVTVSLAVVLEGMVDWRQSYNSSNSSNGTEN